jgi:hypothetical protein
MLVVLAALVLSETPVLAVEGLRPLCSTAVCYAKCEETCRYGMQEISCLEWYNRSSSDGDRDGVAYPGDNCPCNANPDQANCDGDGYGDSCDARSENWVFVRDLGRCEWDKDLHLSKHVVEQYGAFLYQNTCGTGGFCADRYLIFSARCPLSWGGCGASGQKCCECNFPGTWCMQSSCGHPHCPF